VNRRAGDVAGARVGADDGLGAVLLDLDGTLVDTTAAWRRAYATVAAAHGARLADGWWDAAVGRSMAASTVVLGVDPDREPDRAAALAAELTAAGAAALAADPTARTWRPGVAALLAELRATGTPHAVVTAVAAAVAGPLLAGLGVRPDAVVTADAGVPAKPAPDPYLAAAAALGVAPGACLVIEDSPTGTAAAAAAGMAALVVPHAGPVPAGPGRVLRPTLVGVTVADLRRLHAGLRSDAATARAGAAAGPSDDPTA